MLKQQEQAIKCFKIQEWVKLDHEVSFIIQNKITIITKKQRKSTTRRFALVCLTKPSRT